MTKIGFIINRVGEQHGVAAVWTVLNELEYFFNSCAKECDEVYKEDPENNDLSKGYLYAAAWCHAFKKEIEE